MPHRSHNSEYAKPVNDAPRILRDLLLLFDLQVLALFCLAPLAMGGRHEIGRTLFLALVASSVLTWLVRAILQKRCGWYWSGAEPILAAALILVILQLVSLPNAWLEFLSPELHASLPLWNNADAGTFSLGSWQTISVAPSVTQASLIVYVAYAAFFCVLVQRLTTMDDVYRLMKLIAVASFAMAVVGLMQFISGGTEYLWVYHHPARSAAGKVTGSFTNQNHYANFVALGLGPLVWWTYRAKLRARRSQQARFLLPLFMLGLAVLSVLLSFSRGGVLVVAVAALTATILLGRRGLLNRQAVLAIGVCVGVLALALLVHGYAPLSQRLGTLLPGESLRNASRERWDLWRADWHAAQDFLLAGSGAGTHAEVYPRYLSAQYNVRFTHAENCYLQILLENGIVGLALTVAGVLIALGWCIRLLRLAERPVDAALAAGLFSSLLASLIHAAVDFPWYIPSCMTMAIGILAASCRASQLLADSVSANQATATDHQPGERTPILLPRPVLAALALSVVALAALVAPERLGASLAALHWDEYLRQSSSSSNVLLQDSTEARGAVETLIAHLSLAVQNDPAHPQAWQRLAALNMRRFDLEQQDAENAMDSAQIREAVFASQFQSKREAEQWLTRAIGKNLRYLRRAVACARRAAELGAWRGDGYLYLAELSFLLDEQPGLRESLLAQAEKVRPYDGAVMFALGVEEFSRGKTEQALKRWKYAFHRNDELRRRIIEHLGPQAHPTVLIQAFSPTTDTLQQLFQIHRSRGHKEFASIVAAQLEPVLVRRAQRDESKSAALAWYQVADITWYLEERAKSLQYLQRAVDLDDDQYDWRRQLADRLCATGNFSEAAAHYRWCLERTPYDQALERALLSAEKQKRQAKTAQRKDHDRSG